jgi:hypothetical protein
MAEQPTIPTGHFNQFHEALTAYLKAALPGVSVEEHFGAFDLDELKTYGAKAPAVRVSLTGPSPTTAISTGIREAHLVCAAFVVTKSAPNRPAFKDAHDLSELIAARVHRQTFGLGFCEPPKDVVIDNLYSGKLREFAGGVALFSVSWTQVVQFGLETAPLPVATVSPDGVVVDAQINDEPLYVG